MNLSLARALRTTPTPAACLLAAACTGTVSIEPPPPRERGAAVCQADSTIRCASGVGWSCAVGSAPSDYVSNLSCSAPAFDGDHYDFCCFEWTFGSTCTPDDALTTACEPGSFGFRCRAGDDPNSLDASLVCSVPTPDGPDDVFCCR